MWKSLASWAPSRSQWCKVAGCILAVCYGHLESFTDSRQEPSTPRVTSAIQRAGLGIGSDFAQPLLASLSGEGALSALERDNDPDGVPPSDVCADAACRGERDQCWQSPSGKQCRDASFCDDDSCSAPRYTPPIASRYRADLRLPAGYTLKNAWLVLDDATFARSERQLVDDARSAPGIKRSKPRGGVERLVFDVALFRPGINRFKVRGEAVKGSSTLAVETPPQQLKYDVPPELGHIGPGIFRLPLGHFPRTIAACRPGMCKDRDGDGLNDLWENVASTQLRPRLMLDAEDGLFERAQQQDAVAVLTSVIPLQRHGESYVLFAHVVAFSRDYGYRGFMGHAGDTEAAGVLYRVDANETLHWVASSAKGHACMLCKPGFRFDRQEFARDGAPLLFVEKDKHGLWQNALGARGQAGFRCRADHTLRPEAINVGDPGQGSEHGLIDGLDQLAEDGPFGTLAGVFPGDAVWSRQGARVPGRFCGGQRDCSGDNSANQPGMVIANVVQIFQNSQW